MNRLCARIMLGLAKRTLEAYARDVRGTLAEHADAVLFNGMEK